MVYAVFQKLLKAPIGDPFFSVMGPVFFSQGTRFFQSGDPFFQVPDVKTGHLTTFWHPFLSIRETGLNWVVPGNDASGVLTMSLRVLNYARNVCDTWRDRWMNRHTDCLNL